MQTVIYLTARNSASLEVGRGEPGELSPVVSVGGDRKLRPLAAEVPLCQGEGLISGEIWAACFTALLGAQLKKTLVVVWLMHRRHPSFD